MNLHRPAYLALITATIPTIRPQLKPISLEKPYTWRKAYELVPGDVFLTKDGTFIGEVYAVYNDSDGVWIEDTNSEGYVDNNHWFRVEF